MFEKFRNNTQNEDSPRFETRWKEELHCYYKKHHFVVEYTMGKSCTYFPEEAKWKENAPFKIRNDWAYLRDEAKKWSLRKEVGFQIDSTAWVYFDEDEYVK